MKTAYTCTINDTTTTTIRIQLFQHDAPEGEPGVREMAAMTYRLAAGLEALAGAEQLTFAVQPERSGVIRLEMETDADGHYTELNVMLDWAIEACAAQGILPREDPHEAAELAREQLRAERNANTQ